MILHTDFRDYYDKSIGFGVDEKVHYNRFTKEDEIILKTQNDWPVHTNSGLIGFCGKIYPFIKLHRLDKKFCYYENDARPKVVEVCFAYSFEAYTEKEAEWSDFSWDFGGFWDRSRKAKLKQYFLDWKLENDNIFQLLKVPIWARSFGWTSKRSGILNPRLKDYQFERVKNSISAFQEISIYLANILVEQKEIASVEDKYRIQQHGFDLRSSFRRKKKKN